MKKFLYKILLGWVFKVVVSFLKRKFSGRR